MREMKNSGVQWIGEIPADWNVAKVKNHFNNAKEIAGVRSADYERLALTMKGVIKRSKDDSDGLQPADFNTYQIVENNNLIFKLIDLQNVTTSRVGLSPFTGLVSPAYIRLMQAGGIFPKFAEYYFLMMWRNEIFNSLGDSGVRSSLNATELLNLPVVHPNLEEQSRIVSFLDNQCSEIDTLISDIQSQIETLEQYKRSVITEAVTKGLNSNAEMKDSGIEWIGMIPSHWYVDKIKYHLKRNEPRNPGNVQVLSVYREYGIIPKDSRDDNHNVTSEDTSKYKYVRPGDLVINKMKAWQGSLAVSKYEGIVSPAYFIYNFTDEKFNKQYFHFLVRACYKEEFRRISGGIREGQWDLPAEAFENVLVLLPPIEEQNIIVDYLDAKCSEIDACINTKKEQLSTLESYKKSLIYEYVTGKKEVPHD
ncbi:MAG: restriction endonuclease subunit S [Clostridia bacterium]|nr:restriction endonuclease subunit S [Clostridia bacterium]